MKLSQSMRTSSSYYDLGNNRQSQSSETQASTSPSSDRYAAVVLPDIRSLSREETKGSSSRGFLRFPPDLMRQVLMKSNEGAAMVSAKEHGQTADQKQNNFRLLREQPVPQGTAMLKKAAEIVAERNKELALLGAFTATTNVSSPPNKSYFWSGNTFKDGDMIHSAMMTAQSIARKSNGITLEMTEGGHQLDNYSGESNSFLYLKERFKYANPTDTSPPGYAPHKELIEKGVANGSVDMLKQTGMDKTGATTFIPTDKVPAANMLWDNLSMRYANQVSGKTVAVHAMSKDDPYNQDPAYLANTWNTKERPILERNGINIKELHSEDLKSELVGLSNGTNINWEGTGGYRGNLS